MGLFFVAPDKSLACAIYCIAPLVDWIVHREAPREELSLPINAQNRGMVEAFCFQCGFFVLSLLLPIFATHVDTEVGSLWTAIVISGTAPLISCLLDAEIRTKKNLFYALILCTSLALSLPQISLSATSLFLTSTGAAAAIALILATLCNVLYYKTLQTTGLCRVELAVCSFIICSCFSGWSYLAKPNVWIWCGYYLTISWMVHRVWARYAASVRFDSYKLAVASVEKTAFALLLSYPVASGGRGLFPFILLTIAACHAAIK